MKPLFLNEIDQAFAIRQHCILQFNTQDRFFWPENKIQPCNLNYFLAQYFQKQGYRFAQYIPSMGLCELNPAGKTNSEHKIIRRRSGEQDPVAVLNDIFSLLRDQDERWIILMQYGEHLAPNTQGPAGSSNVEVQVAEILHQIAMDDDVARGQSRIILVTYETMPSALLSRSPAYRPVSIGLPSEGERKAFIEYIEQFRQQGRKEFGALEKGLLAEELVRITAGMPLLEIEGLYRAAGHFKRCITRNEVRETKARAIRQLAQDLLEVSEPQAGFDQVAGLQTLKEYIGELLVPQIRAGRPAPQAVLLHGVPGCGKSHVVSAIACELGWPLLEMRNIHGPLVGQSEQQLERVIAVVEQLSPCVLFFDEIDQVLGQRNTGSSGDSGTSERLMARIFNWLGSMHLRGRVLFIGASNRPDTLDPALLDRFRVSIPILKPSAADIKELIPLLANRFDRPFADEIIEKSASFLSDLHPSGRSLQEIIIQAGLRSDAESGKLGSPINESHLRVAADDHLAAEDPLELEFIRLNSLSLCSAQSLLPWNGLHGLRKGMEIPADLLDQGLVARDGRLNIHALVQRLHEIRKSRQMARGMR